jgi:hypothetical protein
MLTIINISLRIEQFANFVHDILLKQALKYYTVLQGIEITLTTKLVVNERTFVDISVLKFDFTAGSNIIFPQTTVHCAVLPLHCTLTIPSTAFPISLVGSLFIYSV